MTTLPTMFQGRLPAFWSVPSKLQGREEIYLEDETPFECWLYVNSWRLQIIDFKEEVALVTCCTRKQLSRKSSAMFVSLLVTGESLAWTRSDDLPTSVPFYCRDSDSGETVDVRMDSLAGETETIDETGSEYYPIATPFCDTGSKLVEISDMKVSTSASETGSFNLTGSGLESTSRLGE